RNYTPSVEKSREGPLKGVLTEPFALSCTSSARSLLTLAHRHLLSARTGPRSWLAIKRCGSELSLRVLASPRYFPYFRQRPTGRKKLYKGNIGPHPSSP